MKKNYETFGVKDTDIINHFLSVMRGSRANTDTSITLMGNDILSLKRNQRIQTLSLSTGGETLSAEFSSAHTRVSINNNGSTQRYKSPQLHQGLVNIAELIKYACDN